MKQFRQEGPVIVTGIPVWSMRPEGGGVMLEIGDVHWRMLHVATNPAICDDLVIVTYRCVAHNLRNWKLGKFVKCALPC